MRAPPQTTEKEQIPRHKLQLVGVTAMFLACKYEEIYYPTLADFIYITSDSYQDEEMLEMEGRMLKALGYALGGPATIHFLRRYSRMAEVRLEGG